MDWPVVQVKIVIVVRCEQAVSAAAKFERAGTLYVEVTGEDKAARGVRVIPERGLARFGPNDRCKVEQVYGPITVSSASILEDISLGVIL